MLEHSPVTMASPWVEMAVAATWVVVPVIALAAAWVAIRHPSSDRRADAYRVLELVVALFRPRARRTGHRRR
jgi:hypothetical protein